MIWIGRRNVRLPPALVFVACLMARTPAEVSWNDPTEYVPPWRSHRTPFSFSIATGIGPGFIVYVAVKLIAGHVHEIGADLPGASARLSHPEARWFSQM